MAEMVRRDLADARARWISESLTSQERDDRERSDFLAYRDHSGRVFDFHAFRHQFASNLAAAGVHPKTSQELLRHSSIELTMGIYTHSFRPNVAAAIESLPDSSAPGREAAAATGTFDCRSIDDDSHSARISALSGAKPCKTVQDSAGKTPDCSVAGDRTERGERTANSCSATSLGAPGFEPGKAYANGFTARPLWPTRAHSQSVRWRPLGEQVGRRAPAAAEFWTFGVDGTNERHGCE